MTEYPLTNFLSLILPLLSFPFAPSLLFPPSPLRSSRSPLVFSPLLANPVLFSLTEQNLTEKQAKFLVIAPIIRPKLVRHIQKKCFKHMHTVLRRARFVLVVGYNNDSSSSSGDGGYEFKEVTKSGVEVVACNMTQAHGRKERERRKREEEEEEKKRNR